jgi:hypothetical protein
LGDPSEVGVSDVVTDATPTLDRAATDDSHFANDAAGKAGADVGVKNGRSPAA